jgi:chromosome-anchoring protein RacA
MKMEMYKTKEVADLLSVSQTTIKRWAAMFPAYFPKDRFGHYIFSPQEVSQLKSIQSRIDQGETLDSITLTGSKLTAEPMQPARPLPVQDKPMQELLSRIVYIERSLDQKADEVVSVQLLRQREELEDLRRMIQQLALSIETMQQHRHQAAAAYEELHPIAAAKLKAPPKKRSLLRTFFSL